MGLGPDFHVHIWCYDVEMVVPRLPQRKLKVELAWPDYYFIGYLPALTTDPKKQKCVRVNEVQR